jgi:hypothetical protein
MVATFPVMSTLTLSFTFISNLVFLEPVQSCEISSYRSRLNHSQPSLPFFEGYNTEWMMVDCSLEVSSHSTPMSGSDRTDSLNLECVSPEY